MLTMKGGPEVLQVVELPVEHPGPGQRGAFYGITALYRKDPKPLREDLPKIFALLGEKRIDPLVTRTFALLEAKQAIELLAAGAVQGKIVLLNS
jgi:NADPH:quinone reductase-like Zn-dependent oxidoreductase